MPNTTYISVIDNYGRIIDSIVGLETTLTAHQNPSLNPLTLGSFRSFCRSMRLMDIYLYDEV